MRCQWLPRRLSRPQKEVSRVSTEKYKIPLFLEPTHEFHRITVFSLTNPLLRRSVKDYSWFAASRLKVRIILQVGSKSEP